MNCYDIDKGEIFMHLTSIFLLSISANIDNLIIGIAYGVKKTKINMRCNIIIALSTFIATFLSMSLG